MSKKRKKKNRKAPWFLKPVQWAFELWLWFFMQWIVLFGPGWAYFWARRIASVLWLWPRVRHVCMRNLELCFPEWTDAKRRQVAKASVRHFCYGLADALLVPRYFKGDRWKKYFEKEPDDPRLWNAMASGKPVFLATAHIGAFEITSFVAAIRGVGIMAIMRQIRPPVLNRAVRRLREAMSVELLDKAEAGSGVLRMIKRGQPLGFLIDQNGGDFAMQMPFMGIPARWQADLARIAVRAEVTMFHAPCLRVNERFLFRYTRADMFTYTRDDTPEKVMDDYRESVEAWVREYPEQYFWLHKRFKGRPRGAIDRYRDLGRTITDEERTEMIESGE